MLSRKLIVCIHKHYLPTGTVAPNAMWGIVVFELINDNITFAFT